jgi:hypothetical protein
MIGRESMAVELLAGLGTPTCSGFFDSGFGICHTRNRPSAVSTGLRQS